VRVSSLTDAAAAPPPIVALAAPGRIDHADGMSLLRQRPRRGLRLRIRVALLFTLAALLVTIVLSSVTYFAARSYLLNQRDESAEAQAIANALFVRTQLRARVETPQRVIEGVRTEGGGFAFLLLDNTVPEPTFYANAGFRYTPRDLPSALLERTAAGETGMQRFSVGGDPFVAVGVRLEEMEATYFEAFSLESVQNALSLIATAFVIGVIATTLLAAAIGYWLSGRLMRPLRHVADAAGEIATGGLDTRLQPEADPDLDRLANSFNDMADAVQARIEREARFSSDVSHELRSPITALSAAVEVLDARRADLPERSQQALDVVVNQVRRFDQLVLDLLELSRLDVGVADVHRDELRLGEVLPRIAARHGYAEVPVVVNPAANDAVSVDKLRLERVVRNLLENASVHAGGASRISVEPGPGNTVLLAVEDGGPGVAASEKGRIFERFARGTASRHRVGGTGLGLALVVEHARSYGGDAWVEDRPGGGARFVVRLPSSTVNR
jgi:two-component system sensor histidine kinase MtrB